MQVRVALGVLSLRDDVLLAPVHELVAECDAARAQVVLVELEDASHAVYPQVHYGHARNAQAHRRPDAQKANYELLALTLGVKLEDPSVHDRVEHQEQEEDRGQEG